ncbi:hypothetical protein ACIQ9P_26435 [Kitasatospora sp. NPDC094019]|uniref:hypothetical protein n=1 Tax=Kitasatospora sp. NPDC094019 TaxID=3364091 RepID=UPI0037FFDAC5
MSSHSHPRPSRPRPLHRPGRSREPVHPAGTGRARLAAALDALLHRLEPGCTDERVAAMTAAAGMPVVVETVRTARSGTRLPHPSTIRILAELAGADPAPLLALRREAQLDGHVPVDSPGLTRGAMQSRLTRSLEGLRHRGRTPVPCRLVASRSGLDEEPGLSEEVVRARLEGRWSRHRRADVMVAELEALLRGLGVPAELHDLWVEPASRAWERATRVRLDRQRRGSVRRRR